MASVVTEESTYENPFEPSQFSEIHAEKFAVIAHHLRQEALRQIDRYNGLNLTKSPLFVESSNLEEHQLIAALSLYGARANRREEVREKELDQLLMGSLQDSRRKEAQILLFEKHGDMLEKISAQKTLMGIWSTVVAVSSGITLYGAASLGLPSQNSPVICNITDSHLCGWISSGIGVFGGAVGAWASLSTQWYADRPASLIKDTLEYLQDLQKQ